MAWSRSGRRADQAVAHDDSLTLAEAVKAPRRKRARTSRCAAMRALAGRSVGSYVHHNGKLAALVEITGASGASAVAGNTIAEHVVAGVPTVPVAVRGRSPGGSRRAREVDLFGAGQGERQARHHRREDGRRPARQVLQGGHAPRAALGSRRFEDDRELVKERWAATCPPLRALPDGRGLSPADARLREETAQVSSGAAQALRRSAGGRSWHGFDSIPS